MSNSLYARFVTASGLTNLTDGIATVAWAWLASLLTRDALLIAIVPVALRLPWFVFALPAGIITDRLDRRKLILQMDFIRTVAFAVVALVIWLSLPLKQAPDEGVSDIILFATIIAASLVVGCAEVFRDNAAQTMLPSIVPHEKLEQANGRLWSVEIVGNALLGPAVGAFLIAIYVPLPFALNAVALALAIACVIPIKGNYKPAQSATPNWRVELREGLTFLNQNRLLRSLAWMTGGWNLLFQMAAIGLVLHSQENMGLGARGYGLMLAAGAIGGILAGFTGEKVVNWLGRGRAAQLSLAASAPAFLAMAVAPGPVTMGIVLAVFEFTGIVWNTVSVSYRQRIIPDAMLGRVNSLYRLLAWGTMPIGLILSGVLVNVFELVGSRAFALTIPFWAAGIGAAFLGVAAWVKLGKGAWD